jgi:hypothetical protein
LQGVSYKAQLAYISNDEEKIGPYSTVGIIKYTFLPHIEIQNTNNNLIANQITGIYSNQDVTEKPYSYQFIIYEDENHKNIYENSGEIIHNNEKDIELGKSEDVYYINKILEPGKEYSVEYIVTTISGMVIKNTTTIKGQIYCIS